MTFGRIGEIIPALVGNATNEVVMITSFEDRATEDLYHGRETKRVRRIPANIREVALRKLDVLNATHQLEDLQSPPGNRLEALRGDWKGYFSIRVNDLWRIVFRWLNGHAASVSVVDYH